MEVINDTAGQTGWLTDLLREGEHSSRLATDLPYFEQHDNPPPDTGILFLLDPRYADLIPANERL